MLEGDVPAPFRDVRAGVLERLTRIGRFVAADVELGFHFCAGHDEQEPRHVPADAGAMVDLANALAAGLERALDWLHLPIPSAPDDAFVEPLRACGSSRGRRSTSACCIPARSTRPRSGGSPSPGRRSMRSASRRRAAGEGWPRRLSPSSSTGTSGSASRWRTSRRRVSRSCGPQASRASRTRTGWSSRSMPSACTTTRSRTTAGTATSTSPSSSSPRTCSTATCSSTTPAAPASCSTACGSGSSTARSGCSSRTARRSSSASRWTASAATSASRSADSTT